MKSLAPNSLIQNRYLIVHLIGKGGMGEVYLAVDQRLGSAVALKRTFFADDEMLGNAFEREARILARLRHPVLPKVSDHFVENGEQYLVMEHIAGEDLAKRLETAQKPFPLSWVLFWADQLLDALAYLHTHEPPIIHRDIKPQNLKLTDENHIVLLDFGLSKNTAGQTKTSGSSGSVVGYTPHYAPMEQVRGTGTDARSDLYSLSATLYQLMTNTIPADALTRADALLNGSSDPITPLDQVNPEVPHEVSTVILHGMEVSQEKRFPDAKSMQKTLRKAYSEMQQAMSAQTMVYNSGSDFTSRIEQPSGNTDVADHHSQPGTGPDSESTRIKSEPSVPTPVIAAETPNFAETIRYDGPIVDSLSRQADIKTEVYSAGNSPFAPELASPPVEPTPTPTNFSSDPVSVPTPPAENWDATIAGTPNGGYSADATVANMAFDAGAPATPYGEATTNYSSTPAPAADSYSTEAHQADVYSSPSTLDAAPAQAFVSQPTPARAQPKKKTSKALWVVGGLAILFFFGLVAAGGGWFVYTNYFEASAQPSPTPEPTLEVTPTPEPTFEAATNTNSNSTTAEANTSANSNSAIFVEPTPEPTTETVTRVEPSNPRETPNIEVRKTPRTNQTAAKPTPKATTTTSKPKILQ
ncbi:MAG TPA: protein kinase [Pyrinomonadaceae bacterium]